MTAMDLEVGKTYRFDFRAASGRRVAEIGRYDGTEVSLGSRWYYFVIDGARVPFEFTALNNLREVA